MYPSCQEFNLLGVRGVWAVCSTRKIEGRAWVRGGVRGGRESEGGGEVVVVEWRHLGIATYLNIKHESV